MSTLNRTPREGFRRAWFTTTRDPSVVTRLALDPSFVADRPPVVAPDDSVPLGEILDRAHPETAINLLPVVTDAALVNRLALSGNRAALRREALAHPLTSAATRATAATRALARNDQYTLGVLWGHLGPEVAEALAARSSTPMGSGRHKEQRDLISGHWPDVLMHLADPTDFVRRALRADVECGDAPHARIVVGSAANSLRARPRLAEVVESIASDASSTMLDVLIDTMVECGLEMDATFARLLVATGRAPASTDGPATEAITGSVTAESLLAGYEDALARDDVARLHALDQETGDLMISGLPVDPVRLSTTLARRWRRGAGDVVRALWSRVSGLSPLQRAAVRRNVAAWALVEGQPTYVDQWLAPGRGELTPSADEIVAVLRAAGDLADHGGSSTRRNLVCSVWAPPRDGGRTRWDAPNVSDAVLDAVLDAVGPNDPATYDPPADRVAARLTARVDAVLAGNPSAFARFNALLESWTGSWSSLLGTVASFD